MHGSARLADCTRGEAHLAHLFLHFPPPCTGVLRHSLASPPTQHSLLLFFSAAALLACKGLCTSSVSLGVPPTSHERKSRSFDHLQRQQFHPFPYFPDNHSLPPNGDYLCSCALSHRGCLPSDTTTSDNCVFRTSLTIHVSRKEFDLCFGTSRSSYCSPNDTTSSSNLSSSFLHFGFPPSPLSAIPPRSSFSSLVFFFQRSSSSGL